MSAQRSPGGMNEVIKGQPDTNAPEALTVKRAKAKTRKERNPDCSGKGGPTAEELRLNPMAGMPDEESKAPAMTAEQRRLNPMAAAGGASKNPLSSIAKNVAKQAITNSIKRSVMKQDLSAHFKQKSFTDSRDKIINLSMKSGLRGINALDVARELRKKLRTQE